MSIRRDVGHEALREALRLRQEHGIGLSDPVCPFDLAELLGLEVWFTDVGSMEGMYWRDQGKILISSHRPPGRQAFTAGHEIGHHVFGHGTQIDDLMADIDQYPPPDEAEEVLASAFSGFLLMPKAAVSRGFKNRGWAPERCTPAEAYVVAQWLGVGYETLIIHMRSSLHLLRFDQAHNLLRVPVRRTRTSITKDAVTTDLFVVDEHWLGRAVDMQVRDVMLLPTGAQIEGQCIEVIRADANTQIIHAIKPGHARCFNTKSGWATFIRVRRRDFVGRNIFRHLEEADNESI